MSICTKMKADAKVARQKLSALELALESGNVREACWEKYGPRTYFSEYNRRFQTQAKEVLKDLHLIHKSQTLVEEIEHLLAVRPPPKII